MSAQSFVGADSRVELYTIAEVGLYFAVVIHPSNTERENTIRLYHTLYDFGFLKLRMLVVHWLDGLEYLLDCLQVFCFARVLRSKLLHNCFYLHGLNN